MKLAIIETPMGKYFYFHFLPFLKERLEKAELISLDNALFFKEKGFLIVSEVEEIADISLRRFIKTEIIYSFSENELQAFKELIDEIATKEA